MTINITNIQEQELVNKLLLSDKEKRFSKALDFMCEKFGYYNHEIARQLVEKANYREANRRGAKARIITPAESNKWKNTIAYSFNVVAVH